MKKRNKGITLVSLVITIIVLLILAGISLSIITNSGVFEKANKAKKVNMLAVAREEVSLAIDTHITDSYINNKKITPKMISDEVNKSNNRETHAENEEQFPTYIIYPETDTKIGEEIQVKIGENLEILEVRTTSGITYDNNKDNQGGSNSSEQKEVGNVKITITDVRTSRFTINVEPEEPENIAMYQYYVGGEMLYEGTEKQYVVRGLDSNTNYEVEVKAIPKTAISIGKVKQKTLNVPEIKLGDKYDKYIYIDAVNGNDDEGNGSSESPYQTLDKIADSGIIEKEYTYGIILKDGTYTLSTKIFSLQCNKSINIIGNKNHTTLNVGGMFNNKVGGSKEYSVNFNRLIWNFTESSTQGLLCYNSITFENVVFINNKNTDSWGFFFPGHAEYFEYRNCIAIGSYNAGLRGGGCVHKVKNCYGKFVPGFGSCDWQEQTNYKTTTPQVDSTTYRITEDSSIWEDVGTGTDLDGSPADLGVYGGEYSWEYGTDLD